MERLLALYKAAQTDSERRILLEAAQISNPGDFPRLEAMILRDQVRNAPFDQLVQMIASHRSITLHQADELLREAVFENLLDQSIFRVPEAGRTAPAPELGTAIVTAAPRPAPSTPALAAGKTGADLARNEHPEHQTVEVVILPGPSQREAAPTVIGNVKPEEGQNKNPSPSPPATPFGRLQPRGISG